MAGLDPPGAEKGAKLTGRDNFDRVYRTGKRIRLADFTIIMAPNSLPYNRLGISIKKRFGSAVERNRAKRLIRELFRRNLGLFPQGRDVIIMPQQGFLHEHWGRRQKDLVDALGRLTRTES